MNGCRHCGAVLPELDELPKLRLRVQNLEEELKLAEADLRQKRIAISKLRGERNQHRQMSPFADKAQWCFDTWNRICRKGKAREFGADRFDPCVERLVGGMTDEDWLTACEGARRLLANEVQHSLRDPKGYTEMSKMLESEAVLTRFIDLGLRDLKPSNVIQMPQRGQQLHDPLRRPLDRMVRALKREYGFDAVWTSSTGSLSSQEVWSVCPLHPSQATPLRLREGRGVNSMVEAACAHGCLPSQVLGEIRRLEDKRSEALVPEPIALKPEEAKTA